MSGDEVYTAFIEGELRIERERRTALEARGTGVVAQSGGLVTLLAGVGALAKGVTSVAPPRVAIVAVVFALVFFFGAALCGSLVNFWPLYPPYKVADGATMTEMRTNKRDHTDEEARSVVAYIHVGTLESLRKINDRKVKWVGAAQLCEIFALLAVSVAVYFIVTHH